MHTSVDIMKGPAQFKAGSRHNPHVKRTRPLSISAWWKTRSQSAAQKASSSLRRLSQPVSGDIVEVTISAFYHDIRRSIEKGEEAGDFAHLTIQSLDQRLTSEGHIPPATGVDTATCAAESANAGVLERASNIDDISTFHVPFGNANTTEDDLPFDKLQPRRMALDQFDVLKLLGSGASGRVFLVNDKLSGQLYALKMVCKKGLTDKRLQSVIDEQRAMIGLFGVPHVVQLVASWHDTSNFYFLMPYYEGGDLASQLAGATPWEADRVKCTMAMLIPAMHAIHAKGVAHRDLKLTSILLTRDGRPVIGGFGSCLLPDSEDQPSTSTDRVGSSMFWAPEQWRGRAHGQPVDIYALGVAMYKLLTGKFPHDHENPSQMRIQVLMAALEWTEDFDDRLNAKEFIKSCMHRNFKRRATIQDLHAHDYFSGLDWSKIPEAVMPNKWASYCKPVNVNARTSIKFDGGQQIAPSEDLLPNFTFKSSEVYFATISEPLKPACVSTGRKIKKPSVLSSVIGWFRRKVSKQAANPSAPPTSCDENLDVLAAPIRFISSTMSRYASRSVVPPVSALTSPPAQPFHPSTTVPPCFSLGTPVFSGLTAESLRLASSRPTNVSLSPTSEYSASPGSSAYRSLSGSSVTTAPSRGASPFPKDIDA